MMMLLTRTTSCEAFSVTILIVNRDLGFVVWLGCALCDAGHTALPATSLREASSIEKKLAHKLDVLIVEPSLAGAGRLAARLRLKNPDLSVVEASEASVTDPLIFDSDEVRPRAPVPNASGVLRDLLAY